MEIGYKIANFFKRNGGTILTCLSSAGVIGTAYLASKAAVKADKELNTLGEDAPIQEKVKTVARIYIPTALAGAGTIACMFGANTLSRKDQASMLAAGALLEQSFKKYRGKAEKLLGRNVVEKELAEDKIDDVPEDPHNGMKLYFYREAEDIDHPRDYADPDGEGFFYAYEGKVYRAEIEINRLFHFRGRATINQYRELLGLDTEEGGDNLGWTEEIGDEYLGYSWIDFDYDEVTLSNGVTCTIINHSNVCLPIMLA